MKINHIIRSKRKAKNLSQEDLATRLGVSRPAVSKWESGQSYPDITLLPALARMLETDLNTLLSFREDLTREEVGKIVNQVGEAGYDKGFEAAYAMAMENIREFPKSYDLIYSLALVLDGGLLIYPLDREANINLYKEETVKLYEEALKSDDLEIKSRAVESLLVKCVEKEDFSRAQKLLDLLPDIQNNKNLLSANMYRAKKDYNKAYELYERELLRSINKVQALLLNLMDLAAIEKEMEKMEVYGDILTRTGELYELSKYSGYIGKLQLSMLEEDLDDTIKYGNLLLESMDETWDTDNTSLYRHLPRKNSSISRIKAMVIKGLEEDERLDFIKGDKRFKKLIEKHTGRKAVDQ